MMNNSILLKYQLYIINVTMVKISSKIGNLLFRIPYFSLFRGQRQTKSKLNT